MLCESCHEREATVKISAYINGNVRQLNLCEQCALKLRQENPGGENGITWSQNFFQFLSEAFQNAANNQNPNARRDNVEVRFSMPLTETLNEAIEHAKEVAAELKSTAVGTEHLLIGLAISAPLPRRITLDDLAYVSCSELACMRIESIEVSADMHDIRRSQPAPHDDAFHFEALSNTADTKIVRLEVFPVADNHRAVSESPKSIC